MTKTVTFIALTFACWNGAFAAYKFPVAINKCRAGDTECIKKEATNALRVLPAGSPGINLVPIDPLHISSISINQGASSPVNIDLTFKDVELSGLKDHVCTKIRGFNENPEGKYELRFIGKQLSLIGPYKISGRILVIPITGKGTSNITIVEPDLKITFTGKAKEKGGKKFLYTDDLKLTFTPTRVWTHFGNLYNGDKTLGDSTNTFLNENWRDIFDEIKGAIFDAFTLIIQSTLNNVFSKVPYDELFLS